MANGFYTAQATSLRTAITALVAARKALDECLDREEREAVACSEFDDYLLMRSHITASLRELEGQWDAVQALASNE